ncbi:hypothetical protein J4410_04490 [Candidatus Woesearchaeota archaeon]|nr:hypothetical protein [Candidatus Woesearchaeota archaeon]
MVVIANSPQWFLGVDSALEILFFFIALGIALFSMKIYRYTSRKRFLFFHLAFLFMAVSFLVRSVTNLFIYYQIKKDISVATKLAAVSNIYDMGFLIHILLMLTAYMILIALSLELRDIRVITLLFLMVILAAVIATNTYTVYYVISVILLAYIVNHFRENAKKLGTKTSKAVFAAFSLLLLSQGVFLFVHMHPYMYLLGHLFQAMAYGMLFIVFILVRRL